jgi:hypothetical protein
MSPGDLLAVSAVRPVETTLIGQPVRRIWNDPRRSFAQPWRGLDLGPCFCRLGVDGFAVFLESWDPPDRRQCSAAHRPVSSLSMASGVERAALREL